MKTSQLWIYFCLLLTTSLLAQNTSQRQFMETFVEREVFKYATLSATVLEVNGNQEVLAYNKHKALIPASTLKLLTTYAALEFLGENYRYKTDLSYQGKILDDGTLEGDVFVIGSGDPTLGSSKLKTIPNFQNLLADMTASIQSAGITCVSNNIIVDASCFNSFPISPSWQWNDLGNYYAGGAWGVNINDNQYYVFFGQRPTEGMVPKILRYGPKIPNITFENEVKTGKAGSGDNAYIYGGPYDYSKRIVGTIPPGAREFSIKGSIPDPPLFLAYHLRYALQKKEIKVNGYKSTGESTKKDQSPTLIKSYTSPTIGEIVTSANFDSNNMFCEALLKTIAKEGDEGEMTHGVDLILDYLSSQSIDVEGFQMDDGSGLSTRNRMSSYLMARFLKNQGSEKGLKWATSFLPQMGSEGTVRNMLKKSPARNFVWAKSGSMEGILSYSGYIKAKSGKWLSFCVIVNGFPDKLRTVRGHLEDLIEDIYLRN